MLRASNPDAMIRIARHRPADSDELALALSGWSQDYTQLGRGRLQAELLQVLLPDAALIYEHSNLHLRETMAPPAHQVVIGLPLCTDGRSLFNGRPLDLDTLLVLEGGREFEICAPGEIGMFGLALDRSLLERLLTPEERELFEIAVARRRLPLASADAQALRADLGRALAAFDGAQGTPPSDPQDAGATVVSALQQVLGAVAAALGGDVADGGPRSLQRHRRLVDAAIDAMQADLARPLSLADLSRRLATSERTLQLSFRQVCRASPQQFFLCLRLADARRRLKQDPRQRITELALELGFASSSHFSSLYKRLYAEQPSLRLRQR